MKYPTAQTLTKIAKPSRLIGKGNGDIIAVKLLDGSITIAKIDIKSNIIHLGNLASAPLAKAAEWQHLARQQEMISDNLRYLRNQGLFAASDADIIIKSHLLTNRQINLPFMISS